MTTPSTPVCAACGAVPGNHTNLWLTNSGDVLALTFTGLRNSPLLGIFTRLGEFTLKCLSLLVIGFGHGSGWMTFGTDKSKAPSSRSRFLWEEAERRGIPMEQVFILRAPTDIFRITINGKRHYFESIPFPPHLTKEVVHIDDKISFKKLMRENGLPVPRSFGVATLAEAKEALKELKLVCVKPRSGSNGRHTYPHVTNETEVETAFCSAKEICAFVSVEDHLEGNVCRATCVDGKMIGFLESKYPTVVGNGKDTIRTLIEKANEEKPDTVGDIVISEMHEGYIRRRGYALDDVLPKEISLPLVYWAGRGSGGRNQEYGRNIHPSFIPLIERAAVLTELPVVGFDLIIPDPQKSADSQKWGFIEANSLPWIDLHNDPLYGDPIDLAPAVWDLWKK